LNLTGGQKSLVANKVNGCIRKNKTKSKIAAAINQLSNENKDYSVSSISTMSGVSRKTVGFYINDLDPIDIDALIDHLIRDFN
jgi:predicted transcriptional regulator